MRGGLRLTLRHFRIFQAVAEEESITRAAERLYLTQPSVSIAIREMETHYGTRFFDRINQRLKITAQGRLLLDHVRPFLSLYDEMEVLFQEDGYAGALRLGGSINVGIYYLPSRVRAFRLRFPQIELQVQVNASELVEKLLLEGQLDLAVMGGPVRSRHLTTVPLFQERHVAVCGPDDPLAGRSVSLHELLKAPLLLRERGSGAYEVFQSALAHAGQAPTPVWESVSQESLLAAVRCGLGVTLLPEEMVRKDLEDGRLAPICLTDVDLQNTVHLVHHKNKYLSPAMRSFISLLYEDREQER